MRVRGVRAAALVIGGLSLIAGVGFIAMGLAHVLRWQDAINGIAQVAFGWILFSHGLGWATPFRKGPKSA